MIIDRNVLVRYFLGDCTEEEKVAIHQWLESDDANKQEFVRERIRFDASLIIDEDQLLSLSQPVTRNNTFKLLKIAAFALLLIGSSFILQFLLYKPVSPTLQQIYIPPGSRTSVTLPDGTSVWLNSNSTFIYPNIFSEKYRIVELNGEGYFDVTTNPKKPFIIKTNKFNVEVLGTTLNLEAYAKEPVFKTSLYNGKVRIYKDDPENEAIYLNPGEAAELVGEQLHVIRAGSYSYRWKDGLIILEDQSFRDIMHLFEKYFDLNIIIRNEKVQELRYEGKLRIVDGVDHALRLLQNDFRFTYQREEETNIIYIN